MDVSHPAADPRASILVVDDEDLVRRLVCTMLERSGHDVMAAESAEHAVALLEGGPGPDLLVSDIVMPGMGGRALGSLLAERYPEMRILFMSGYSEEIALHGEEGGTVQLLHKPFSSGELAEAVSAALAPRVLS